MTHISDCKQEAVLILDITLYLLFENINCNWRIQDSKRGKDFGILLKLKIDTTKSTLLHHNLTMFCSLFIVIYANYTCTLKTYAGSHVFANTINVFDILFHGNTRFLISR